MHIHFLGIAGTFMGNLAILAAKLGFEVSGQDVNFYPPMSEALKAAKINYSEGYKISHIPDATDLVIVGNIMSRGMEVVEWMLDANINYTSGPSFINAYILNNKHNFVVTGTHGKTTTTSMLAWILTAVGYNPGYLIGGVACNFELSANLGSSEYFVIEGDEYDSCFFDKRAKFVHYKPNTVIITGIEYDHADIYPNLEAIKTQFHHLARCVPATGKFIVSDSCDTTASVLEQGCWSGVETFGENSGDWESSYLYDEKLPLVGRYNYLNATAAIAAAAHVGIDPKDSIIALKSFKGVKRRLEQIACNNEVKVFDDFAHHPTAIAASIQAVVDNYPSTHICVVVELGSNTMRSGIHKNALLQATSKTHQSFWYSAGDISWKLEGTDIYQDVSTLQQDIFKNLPDNSIVLLLSNRSFDGLRENLKREVNNRKQLPPMAASG